MEGKDDIPLRRVSVNKCTPNGSLKLISLCKVGLHITVHQMEVKTDIPLRRNAVHNCTLYSVHLIEGKIDIPLRRKSVDNCTLNGS